MKKAGTRGKVYKNPHEQALNQWLELAMTDLSRGLAKERQANTDVAASGNWDDLLSVLYSTQTTTTTEYRSATPQPITPAFSEALARFQIFNMDMMLKTQMGLERGLADNRIIILIITPFLFDHAPILLAHISRTLAVSDCGDGLAEMKKATGRIWKLDGTGLAAADMSKFDIERIYGENQGISASSPSNTRSRTGKQAARRRQSRPPILAVLGFLPFQDEIDRELLTNGYALARVKTIAEADEQPQAKEHEVVEKYAHLLRYGPMSLRDYWDAFELYLKTPSLAGSFEPVTPGVYRELFEQRRQMRNTRIQCLQPYTGLYRVGAGDADIMAGCQPIFFRFVEAMLHEAGQGVASLVADPEFLHNADMTGMRKHLVETCSCITIDHMMRIGDIDAELHCGEDKNAAAGTTMSESRQPALAIYGELKTSEDKNSQCVVLYRVHSSTDLAQPLSEDDTEIIDVIQYQTLAPNGLNKYSFLPPKVSRQYLSWLSLPDLAAIPSVGGMLEKRGGALVDIDRDCLERRMRAFFDKNISWDRLVALGTGLTESQSRFDPQATRKIALETSEFRSGNVMPYSSKPFDNRWCYHSGIKSLWSDPKPQLAALQPGNSFVISRARKAIADEGIPFFFTPMIGDGDLLRGHTYYFPRWYQGDDGVQVPNLSASMLKYLDKLGITAGISHAELARLVWNHVLAIGFSSAYLNENAVGIAQGWPRIPFPAAHVSGGEMIVKGRELFLESSRLGEMVANLLDLTAGVEGVSQGELRPDFACMAIPWDIMNNAPFPIGSLGSVPITMEWGKLSKEKAVLPSYGGMMSRDLLPKERLSLEEGARIGGVRVGAAYACLGDKTWEIRLSDQVGIWNIPTRVWHFTLGGYRVLQKWLSYRVAAILGRPLAYNEVELFCQIVRRIAALLLLGPRLNQNYAMIRDSDEAIDG